MSIYVMMISLPRQNVLDVVIVVCAVGQGQLLLDELTSHSADWLATARPGVRSSRCQRRALRRRPTAALAPCIYIYI